MPSNVVVSKRRDSGRLVAIVVTLVVLAAWPLALSPLIDLETLAPASGAHLALGPEYVILAPICDVMDALTLLSVSQTVALLVSLAALYVVWRELRWRRFGTTLFREIRFALVAVAALVLFYFLGVVAPRPMARLTLDDPNALSIDVHSHTRFSHDGRSSFTPEANRAWHRDAGFDVAYITDHSRFAGAREAARENPARAGGGLTSLPGIEYVANHNHLLTLGASDSTSALLTADPRRTHATRAALSVGDPVIVQTIPDNLDRFPPPDSTGLRGAIAIELSDGSPRGIEQSQRDRARILHLADSLDLALVAGSDNHGWGRTAVAWSVMRIPGWRALSPDSLGEAIAEHLRVGRRRAVEVIARRSPDAGQSGALVVATLPTVGWNILRTMSPLERLSWMAWAWIVTAAVTASASRLRTAA
ncbi:MAG TPA: hypothetical protein VGR59_15630 [Gemmatimonadaceae bacterium]|nr:hypothetical protein [Gemmatimonadaceae bacterium]